MKLSESIFSKTNISKKKSYYLTLLSVNSFKGINYFDVATVFLAIVALALWSSSLKNVNLSHMNDLGLISVLPVSVLSSLAIMMLSFCLALYREPIRGSVLFFHVVLLIFMLYGITTLIEPETRFVDVYKHVGYIEYITRTGSFDPTIYIYPGFPIFFSTSALLTQIAGFTSALSFVGWSQVFFNFLYLGPLYLILTSATTNKRLIWLSIWVFFLTKWVDQDHFSPQAFDYFLYLIIIAIMVHWFKVTKSPDNYSWPFMKKLKKYIPLSIGKILDLLMKPDGYNTPSERLHRMALLSILILIFVVIVSSHPLTPFFVLMSISALVIFHRCTPFWLPILLGAIIVIWLVYIAHPYLNTSNLLTSSLGKIDFSSNLTNRLQGSPQHKFIATMRSGMAMLILLLTFLGIIKRLWRGHNDLTYILLVVAPFPLFLVQSYGGEMLIRIYLFSLPLMAFFTASLFHSEWPSPAQRWSAMWKRAGMLGVSLMLLGGFLFTRYGTERVEYYTSNEVNAIRYLYTIAPVHSLVLQAFGNAAYGFQDEEKYPSYVVDDAVPKGFETRDIRDIVNFLEHTDYPKVYLVITRNQIAMAESTGLPPNSSDLFEKALLSSGRFKLIYNNSDAQIFTFVDSITNKSHSS